ncbi:hypothetical protein MEW_04682 [Candida albicans P60002]|uniref:Secreted protein n=1 Tax=Candida albicans (strain WO-1) TaxID=294748 RepID=C4YSL0_CANAW|nr:conserved hypothetical protein [Candida albicans WO-1]KGQ84274.1 hypothetical protein MEO_04704 [Candida albicans P94015]KGU25828.1 hypothetical protein MGK_04764 [Candida albicans P57055]KHC47798.1 hypothetical protein MEW_04682 [Candida albicans P60002]KHC63419.1 hypothetical protein MGI_04729 [Candida albicans P75016]KHC70880.1 hypothetical protein MGS_04795 [Candida albicans P78042]
MVVCMVFFIGEFQVLCTNCKFLYACIKKGTTQTIVHQSVRFCVLQNAIKPLYYYNLKQKKKKKFTKNKSFYFFFHLRQFLVWGNFFQSISGGSSSSR